jgi:hypothetical protein
MKISLFDRLFAKRKKTQEKTTDLIRKGHITLIFGDRSWRIESKPIEGKSNLKLFANNKMIFEGSYGELISRVK